MTNPKVMITRLPPRAGEASLGEAFDVPLKHADRTLNTIEPEEAIMTADAVSPTVSARSSQRQNKSGKRHASTG